MVDIYTDMERVMRNQKMTHRLKEIKIINLQRAEFKDTLKSLSGPRHHWAPGQCEVQPDGAGWTETQCLRCSVGFRSGEHCGQSVVSSLSSSKKLPAYSYFMRPGIVMQQEEPSTHCTIVGSVGSKGFIQTPTLPIEVCVSLHRYASPDFLCSATKLVMLDNVTVSIMFSSAASGLFISVTWVNLFSCVKGTGCQWWTWQFWYSIANINQALCFRAVSAGSTRGHRPIRPLSLSLFLIVWWPPGGHFVALAVLIMFLLTQRSRCRSSWLSDTDPSQMQK